jgi:16S rRNA (guanine527-N7)-methyltransferase
MQVLKNWLTVRNIPLTEAQLNQLIMHQALVLEANKRINLTAITSGEDFAVKHFIDSLSLLPWLPKGNFSLLDIGTGAGFPGVPLKITRPDMRLVLADSLRKRVFFLREALAKLDIQAECLHVRVEDMPRLFPGITFDRVTARAVAHIRKLCKYALPLLNPGGLFLAMKGPDVSREIEEAATALNKYGGFIKKTTPVEIAPGMVHTVVVIQKITIGFEGVPAKDKQPYGQ